MNTEPGEGSPREIAYGLIDDALDDMLGNSLYGVKTKNYRAVFDAVVAIKQELAQRREKEHPVFDWSRVVEGATFYHARYKTRGYNPQKCRIDHITRDGDTIVNVFYVIGTDEGTVYNPRDEFPAVVQRWGP